MDGGGISMKMKDKVCLVTGSTCGIGETIARLFLSHGASVLVTGLDGSLAWNTDGDAERIAVVSGDVADVDTPRRLVSAALEQFGRLDVLVNNAASTARFNADATTAEVFDRMMAVNVRAPLLLCKEAFPALKQSGGCILNIGSINGYSGQADLLPYSISKGALHTMSRNLADAWSADHIRVNHFVLGWVLTPNEYQLKLRDGLGENWHLNPPEESVPFGTMTSPETIAAAALYWCSQDSWPLSGNTIELEQFPMHGRMPMKRYVP
jgi:NAD(P)-dependent dehydrogenase (short-subunit alcohol dehydrogenase family)